MHAVTDPADPLIVSLSGSVSLSEGVVTAIRSKELESEGAFAGFSSTCHALAPQWFVEKQFEAHEAFWCFGDGVCNGQIRGELAWFQMGVYNPAAALLMAPLLVHAGVTAVDQLGTCILNSVRIQVPSSGCRVNEEAVQQLFDQFSVLSALHSSVEVHAQLMSRADHERWTSTGATWFENTNVEPLALQGLGVSYGQIAFDDRWSFRRARSACTAVFSAPEWSVSVASTIAVLMIEAGRAAGINETVVVEVSCT